MTEEGSVTYSFEIEDNVTPAAESMGAAQEKLATKAEKTTNSFEKQRIKNIETLTALRSFKSGLSDITSSLNTLGVVDDKTYQSLQKVVAGISLVTGTAETLKGAAVLMQLLTAKTSGYAVASVFAAVAAHPLWAGAALAGAGAVAGAYVLSMNDSQRSASSSSSSTTNNTTVNFVNGGSNERNSSAALAAGSYYS